MKVARIQTLILLLIPLHLSDRTAYGQKPDDKTDQIKVITVQPKNVTVTQRYTCKINSHRHIAVRALWDGYLVATRVKEGQAVKRGDVLFRIRPLADEKTPNVKNKDKLVSITAPFDGLIDRFEQQQGSLIKEGDRLTTLSDNAVMWVYFGVPEKRYLEYMAEQGLNKGKTDVELTLANGIKFPQVGKLGAIDAKFDNQTGTIAFRADFPNPDGLLRHGQTGTVSLSRILKDAIVIPQRATFETRNKRYIYLVDEKEVAHRREVAVQHEVDDQFVVETGVRRNDKIVVEGVRRVRDGEKVKRSSNRPHPGSL